QAPPAQPVPGERQRALVMKRDVVVAPNANPFLRAAGPLLLLLGRLRVQLSHASFSNLMEQVAASIDDFETQTRSAGVSAEQVRAAKYVVCATADDIVQNIPTDERHVWTQYSMLSRFFGERVGGVRFFEELDRAKVDPGGNYHLLELIHACLGIGFQGMHRTSGGGAANLQQIQRNLYELLRRTRQVSREVSPRWQGQLIVPEAFRVQIPLWATGAVIAVLLLGFFLLLRTLLTGNAEATADGLVTVHPTGEIGLQRRIYTPPPPPPPPPPASQAGQYQEALRAEIADNSIAVIENGSQIVLRVAAALFAPADAQVKPAFKGLVQRLAGLLEKGSGPIKVVGHTDVIPIKTVRFPSNFVLSEARAKAVAEIMKAGLTKPERVEVEGKGADVPVGSNKTPEGRARNRRVDIVVPRNR
ncbi:type IVB secretion system protein IcmH/DotU, partial [Methylobacterium trifolii]